MMKAGVKARKSEQLKKQSSIAKSVEVNIVVRTYALEQNYPNPFNPATVIKYQIPTKGKVRLAVFDILGKKISDLVDQEQNAGVYRVTFGVNSTASLASGVYYYTLDVVGEDGKIFKQSKKMVILK